MTIKLLEKDELNWNLDSIEFIKKYGKYSFDYNISSDEITKIEELLEQGIPQIRDKRNFKHRIFEIISLESEVTVGIVTFNLMETNNWEIDVGVYEQYQEQGIAKNAINKTIVLLKNEGKKNLEATVLPQNPFRSRIISLLKSLGFKESNDREYYYLEL